MDDKWFSSAFQIFEATDENDLKVDMMVLRGEHMMTKIKENGVLAWVRFE